MLPATSVLTWHRAEISGKRRFPKRQMSRIFGSQNPGTGKFSVLPFPKSVIIRRKISKNKWKGDHHGKEESDFITVRSYFHAGFSKPFWGFIRTRCVAGFLYSDPPASPLLRRAHGKSLSPTPMQRMSAARRLMCWICRTFSPSQTPGAESFRETP